MASYNELLGGKPLFKYLDVKQLAPVGGRGAATRFLMLVHGIEFDEELVGFDAWGAGEKENVTNTLNPAGALPVVKVGDKWLSEHIAISRYLSRKMGLYGKDAELDYESDVVADQYQIWRDSWAATLLKEPEHENVKKFLEERPMRYALFEAYYARRSDKDSVYLIPGDLPGFADCAVFNMIRDDMVVHGKHDISEYTNLSAMYDAVAAIPAVADWIKKQES